MTADQWPWICPACRAPLQQKTASLLQCPSEGTFYPCEDGIWRFLTPEQQTRYAPFINEYDIVRSGEQWGSDRAAYYRALPFRDLSGQHPAIWRIRAITFRTFLKRVLHPLASERQEPLRMVDAGAGNGWLAYRLAQEGHQVLATDLRTDKADGLGAHIWYRDASFTAVQTPFESIPLANASTDLFIFAGSFHYATDYVVALREARRTLQDTGRIVILESPVYRKSASGEQMVRELRQRLQQEHGVTAAALEHQNYLTLNSLREIGRQVDLRWEVIRPFYGWRWTVAPLLARLRGRREPARFYILIGTPRS
jgi:ubiquinone/menaquinone biosynthesis C-methylase UbiE